MHHKNIHTAAANFLIVKITGEFSRGTKLLESLEDEIYTKTSNGVGSIGSHFRHNLDFAGNLLKGAETGRVDYNERERDRRVETDRQYARERFLSLIEALKGISETDLRQEMLVRSELDATIWHRSTIGRELEFLHSHSVHHFALIAEKLHTFGIRVPNDFGVAPSTLKYWSKQTSRSKVA